MLAKQGVMRSALLIAACAANADLGKEKSRRAEESGALARDGGPQGCGLGSGLRLDRGRQGWRYIWRNLRAKAPAESAGVGVEARFRGGVAI